MNRKKHFFSLRNKIFIIILTMAMIPLVIVGYISYSQITYLINDKFMISRQNTVDQISDNIQFIINDILDLTLYIIQDDNTRLFLKSDPHLSNNERDLLKLKINNSLSNITYMNKYIYSIEIEGFNSNRIETQFTGLVTDDQMRDIALDLNGFYYWYLDAPPEYPEQRYLSLIRIIKDINNLETNLALLRINIRESYISEILTQTESSDFYYLVDESDRVLSASDNSLIEHQQEIPLPDRTNNVEKPFFIEMAGKKYLVTYADISNCGWSVMNLASYSELTSNKRVVVNSILIGVMSSFMLCIIAALFFSLKVLSPLKQFRFLMKRIENSDFDIVASERGNDEFALLGQSFNKMSGKLKELMDEIIITANKKREAELKALEAQINPHFLYNTLDTIYWKARLEKAFGTANLVEALSKLFRLSLNRGNEMTDVGTEIENLNNYMFIQKNRYEDLIDFSIDVPADLLKCRVLKLILQPMVENAIYHGIKALGEPGKIKINIFKLDETLVYQIIDTGAGADLNKVSHILSADDTTQKSSMGIKNVHDRIRLFHGPRFGIEFKETEIGTFVQITQPCIIEEPNNGIQHFNRR